jgi:hypothetical protein
MVIANVAGNPVEGESFFDREREIALLWSRLETDSILLLAPRRVGKTSLMYRLRDTATERRFLAVYVSVADARTEFEFVQRLYEGVGQHRRLKRVLQRVGKGSFGRWVRRVTKLQFLGWALELDGAGREQWAGLGDALAREIARDLGPPRKLLLLVDEMPLFVLTLLREDPSATRARAFLNWFRQLRLEPEVNPRVRWLIAGSIGLDTVTRRARLSDTINDLFLFSDLGAFSDETADRFLVALATAYGLLLPRDVRTHILRRLGWPTPHQLQLVFAELRAQVLDHAPTTASVDVAFERLLSPSGRGYLDWWRQRLHEQLGPPGADQSMALLDAAASDPNGASLIVLQTILAQQIHEARECTDQLQYLLDVLQSDGYLVRDGERMRFRSALLAEFWRRRLSL